jgi:hypothetical protein
MPATQEVARQACSSYRVEADIVVLRYWAAMAPMPGHLSSQA